ncbi:MAG: glutamine-hydrolyzing GMP synthase [Candidatus Pacebacteria bacterium]|nr:glutamine-hydrolyzing GMP synthase [Candidatus Paceibacterota bacterium]
METIVILDFGSQFTQLIARRVREAGVYCEILPFNSPWHRIEQLAPRGIILSGGPASVTESTTPRIPMAVFDLGVPILGICYGQQVLAAQLGGKVEPGSHREFGRANLQIHVSDSPLFTDIPTDCHAIVWMSHGDRVSQLPDGFTTIATSANAPHAAISDENRKIYGLQFHPEVVHTQIGKKIIQNFVQLIVGCQSNWTMANFRNTAIADIRNKVGKGRVICGLSGGVDSSVVAVLLHEAIGEQLTCVFVDTGLMRRGEADQVVTLFRDHYNIPLVSVDASAAFFAGLAGVTDPEVKRKTIGAAFIDVFDREAKKFADAEFLAQGTLYPDVVESVSVLGGPSVTIKSHHNVGGLPERMNLKLVEPLRALFKDEVRALGRELGMPESLVGRHPFPGPGLAIRIPGEVTRDQVALLQRVDEVYLSEIRLAGLYDEIWQAFAVLLPVRSVGVMGDSRSYDQVVALRAVTSVDGMTADFYHFSHEFLGRVATRIINEVKGVNRVVYDITSKPPGTIEWE